MTQRKELAHGAPRSLKLGKDRAAKAERNTERAAAPRAEARVTIIFAEGDPETIGALLAAVFGGRS